ncbi:putative HlyD family secretion protein [Sterolibacterium denitrificans]|uniref:HlyD family secretion protein n=2 Tax=Sterolibacterium denitrificans TaxID=157592 RepID=A0A7Z7HRC5_9PROT|nr:putative HlyD family secretion protein [Sterolibacterium denitrificans]
MLMKKPPLLRLLAGILLLGIVLAWFYWQHRQDDGQPEAFASGNGRLEARQIDIASKFAGRLEAVHVEEGDRVSAGQVLAELDVAALQAALHEARAQLRRAEQARGTAEAMLAQRHQAEQTAQAYVEQRESEVEFAGKQLQRTQELLDKGFNTRQQLDLDQTRKQGSLALLGAAQSQVAESQAGVAAARSQVTEAQAAIEVARAAIQRLQTELDDTVLKAPRDARVQYRLAEPGEILPAGGKVLTLLDLAYVTMNIYLPENIAGQIAIGSEARLVLDAAPDYVLPARVAHVAAKAQFTPKSVETASERQKLVLQVKLQLDPQLLKTYEAQVKSGLPGQATVRLDPTVPWPAGLAVKLPPVQAAPQEAAENTAAGE